MITNILIAGAFFVIGFFAGGVFTLRQCMKHFDKKAVITDVNDPLVLKIYGPSEE